MTSERVRNIVCCVAIMDAETCSPRVVSRSRCYADEVSFQQMVSLPDDDFGDELHRLDIVFDSAKPIKYEMYVMDVSYFSGKLEAYFRFKRINFTRIEVTHLQMHTILYRNTGLQQVPIVHDLENDKWLRDTTSIIELFEQETQGEKLLTGSVSSPLSCDKIDWLLFVI